MSKNNSVDYSIGIVTFLDRFDKSFKKLVIALSAEFPEVEKNVILNGSPDKVLQLKYLKDATSFLSAYGFNHVLTYEDHQPLARCWNLLAIVSDAPKILILNDDCDMKPGFRGEFENQRGDRHWLFINESFSHFQTSKEVIKRVGWFDERFKGIGHEDGDYARRCAIENFEYDVNITCKNLKNLQLKAEKVTFTDKSSERCGNYSKYNEIFFKKKWKHADKSKKGYTYIPIRHLSDYKGKPPGPGSYCKLRWKMETPMFYSFSILD